MGSHSTITGHWTVVLLVFSSSYGLALIQHRLFQYPVILNGYPSNKIYMYTLTLEEHRVSDVSGRRGRCY